MSPEGKEYIFTNSENTQELRDEICQEVKKTKNKKALQIVQLIFSNNIQHIHTVREADNTFLFILKSGKIWYINADENTLNIGTMPKDEKGNIDFRTLRIDAYIHLEYLDSVQRITELLKK